jgi:hypothetical protein
MVEERRGEELCVSPNQGDPLAALDTVIPCSHALPAVFGGFSAREAASVSSEGMHERKKT